MSKQRKSTTSSIFFEERPKGNTGTVNGTANGGELLAGYATSTEHEATTECEAAREHTELSTEETPPALGKAKIFGRLRWLRKMFSKWLHWPRLSRRPFVRLIIGLSLLAVIAALLAFGLLRILAPRERIGNFTLPFVEEFSTVDLKTWLTREGVWTLREDMLAQIANLEQAANIYAPYRMPADQPYHLSVYVVLTRSTRAAGVNFNAQYPNLTRQQHQVYIARVETAEGNAGAASSMELVAGYTDENGKFVRQVAVPFNLDTIQYRLDVYVLGNQYTVQLNGQTLIERRPLFYKNGLVGFTAEGTARFDTLRITTAALSDPGNQVYISDFDAAFGGAGWVPLSGDWTLDKGELVQVDPAILDAAIGYEGSAFENYVVQATFRHLAGVGGGLLFNMASPYQIHSAYVVRYSEQADAVFWGFFDEKGLFTRQGYAETPPAGTDFHVLAVYVGFDSYDVYLDDRLLVRNVPFQNVTPAATEGRAGGHIGLITSRSSVAFAQVEVFPLLDNARLKLPQPQPLQAAAPSTPASSAPAPSTPASSAPAPLTPTPSASTSVVAAPSTDIPATPSLTLPPSPAARPRISPAGATPLPPDAPLIRQGSDIWNAEFRGDLNAAGWQPISGQWSFVNGMLVQNDLNGVDLAIAYIQNAFQNYIYEVSFTHREGQSAGILFNMPFKDRLNGAHMVRYSERRPGGVFWGYFDEQGKFVGQGYTNVDPPANVRHTLRVISGETTYSVYLDDFALATDLPLHQNFGYVGLVTVQSTALYDAVAVRGLEKSQAASAEAVGTLTAAGVYTNTAAADRRVLSGQWEIERGVYRQTVPDAGDYILNTGVYASHYRIEADIALPTIPYAGGGFIIHMPERGRRHGATVVRFIRGGSGLFWGAYDASGTFVGRGSIELSNKSEGDNLYHLLVEVRGSTMDILVDGERVATEIALPRGEGWVGLIAHGGPVTFTGLQIVVEGIQ